jgi:mannose-1-phosphate guanylyltransferase
MSPIHPIIMAGGRGTRFWPASREGRPKQFLPLEGKESMLRRTGRRLEPLAGAERIWIVTNAAHVDVARRHLPEIPPGQVVGEPVGRNTAPCVALAAALVSREDPSGVLLIAPADHWIEDEERFRHTARFACDAARERGGLVTFGVVPTSPETGYGYIEAGDPVDPRLRRVARFTEKPDRATAEAFLKSGRHFWNSGIFAWRADVFLEELESRHPEMVASCRRIAAASDLEAALADHYCDLTSISVDYAVLEHSANVWVVPADFPWSDVGSWNALSELLPADGSGNVIEGDALALDSRDCLVRSSSRFTAVIGLEGVLVVDTPDALLVCPKDRAQDVKKVVETLGERGRRDLL